MSREGAGALKKKNLLLKYGWPHSTDGVASVWHPSQMDVQRQEVAVTTIHEIQVSAQR